MTPPNTFNVAVKSMRLRLFFCLAIVLSFIKPAKSQDSIRCGTWVGASAHYGFIIPLYSNAMDYLLKAHVPALELDYLQKPAGNKPWQQAYHCPEMGVAFFYAWLGNPNELGNLIGIYPYLNFHLNKSYREALYFRLGWGASYMPVIFDRVNNHKDNLIGAHFNTLVNLRLTTHIYLSQRTRLEAGLGITHCSDGNFSTPNLGINLLTVNAGLSYCINPYKVAPKKFVDTITRRKPENEFIVGLGLSQIEPPGGDHYGAITLSYTRYYPLSYKSKLGGGIDVFYNAANIAALAADTIYLKSRWENVQLGIKACYELNINKLALPIEMGYYVYTKFQSTGNIFNRIGLRYYANKHLILNLTLLTHFASAVYIEWGAGYRF